MPEDVIEEEISEQIEDKEGEPDFDTFVSDTEVAEEEEPETDKKVETDKKSEESEKKVEDEKKPEEKKEDDKEEEPEEELEPEDKLDQIIKERGIEEELPPSSDDQPPSSDSKQEGLEEPPKGTTSPALTKEVIADHLKLINNDELPGEVIIGNDTINLKEYAKEYPEEFNATKILSATIAQKMVEDLIEKGVVVTQKSVDSFREDATKAMNSLYQEVSDLKFWNEVMEVHADAIKINKDSAFKEVWLEKQSKGIQALAKALQTPADAITIIDLYKKDIAKGNVEEFDKKKKDKKKKSDDLHKGTIKSKTIVSQTDEIQPDEDEKAFDEHAK